MNILRNYWTLLNGYNDEFCLVNITIKNIF